MTRKNAILIFVGMLMLVACGAAVYYFVGYRSGKTLKKSSFYEDYAKDPLTGEYEQKNHLRTILHGRMANQNSSLGETIRYDMRRYHQEKQKYSGLTDQLIKIKPDVDRKSKLYTEYNHACEEYRKALWNHMFSKYLADGGYSWADSAMVKPRHRSHQVVDYSNLQKLKDELEQAYAEMVRAALAITNQVSLPKAAPSITKSYMDVSGYNDVSMPPPFGLSDLADIKLSKPDREIFDQACALFTVKPHSLFDMNQKLFAQYTKKYGVDPRKFPLEYVIWAGNARQRYNYVVLALLLETGQYKKYQTPDRGWVHSSIDIIPKMYRYVKESETDTDLLRDYKMLMTGKTPYMVNDPRDIGTRFESRRDIRIADYLPQSDKKR